MAGLSGGSTQEEVLAIALQKLELCPGDRVLDLGCGTGRVAVAVSGSAAEVIAIDRRPEAIECARRVSIEAGANNIIFFEGEAADLLPSLGSFDVAFVGGTRGLSGFLPVLVAEVRRRIVVNAVLVETLHRTVSGMKELGVFREAIHVQCARATPLAGSFYFRPIDPVFVIVGEGQCS